MKRKPTWKAKWVPEKESDIQKRIVDYLEAHGFLCFQNRSDGLGGKIAAFATTKQAGSPDLFVWGCSIRNKDTDFEELRPRHFAIEVKRKGGKQSDAQIAWAGKYCAIGFHYVLAYGHEDVEQFLKEKGWL